MSETIDVATRLGEWTYHEDEAGIVYCLGRNIDQGVYEAVAVYERSTDGQGLKHALEGDAVYNRLMYHGFPEEDTKLEKMRPDIRASLVGNLSLRDRCMFVDPTGMTTADRDYRTLEAWLSSDDARINPFKKALETACTVMDRAGISLTNAELYGGAAFGLVSKPDKVVDDVDLILKVSSAELYAGSLELQEPISWNDIDPNSILSKRRQLLKAKRWSTSQIRIFNPDFLSIDLKAARDPSQDSLWDELPVDSSTSRFEGDLKVVDDTEAYCISPAVICEDNKGERRPVLFRGYPYIGCAVKGDMITVRGRAYADSGVVLVTQSADDILVPDFSKVPIS
jgi:hypothetical protein